MIVTAFYTGLNSKHYANPVYYCTIYHMSYTKIAKKAN